MQRKYPRALRTEKGSFDGDSESNEDKQNQTQYRNDNHE